MSFNCDLQKAIDEVKAKGIKSISVENLENWLGEQAAESSEVDLQTRDLVHQSSLAEYRATCEANQEAFRSILRISEFVIRWMIIVSGSACVALLALIGNIWNNSAVNGYICTLLDSLKWFGGSTLAALASAGLFYLTQIFYREYKTNKLGDIFRVITIITVVLAILSMATGSIGLSVNLSGQLKKPKKKDVSTLEAEIDQLITQEKSSASSRRPMGSMQVAIFSKSATSHA